jgi:hypothetical protein
MRLFKSLKNQATGYVEQFKQRDPASYAAAQQAVGGLLILDGFIGIDNPLSNNKRPGIFGTLIGIILGIIFMFIPTIFSSVAGIKDLTATTNGVVTSVGLPSVSRDSDGSTSSSCSFSAKYTVAGKLYQSASSMSSSSYCQLSPEQQVKISYNPKNPAQWGYDIKTIGLFLSIFFWVGLLVALTSLVTFVIRLASIIFGWKLFRSGRKLAASLPEGINLGAMVDEIKRDFTHGVFGLASAMGDPAAVGAPQPIVSTLPIQSTQPMQPVQAPAPMVQTGPDAAQPLAPVQVPVPPRPAQPFQTPRPTQPVESPDK